MRKASKAQREAARDMQAQVTHLTIERAFADYKDGKIGPWDLQEVVEKCGFSGWTGTSDGKLIVHTQIGRC